MWANADQKVISQHPSVSDGWKLDDSGIYEIIWFEGPQLPTALIPDADKIDENENDDSDVKMNICSSDDDDVISSDDESNIIDNTED